KNRRRDLVVVVERAKDEPLGRQPAVRSRWSAIGDHPPRIVRLIAVRQINELFGEVACGTGWDNEVVDDRIVDEIRAHGAGIPKISNLYGRGAIAQDSGPVFSCIALQIDRDVYFHAVDLPGRLLVRQRTDIVEAIEGLVQTVAHGTSVVLPE